MNNSRFCGYSLFLHPLIINLTINSNNRKSSFIYFVTSGFLYTILKLDPPISVDVQSSSGNWSEIESLYSGNGEQWRRKVKFSFIVLMFTSCKEMCGKPFTVTRKEKPLSQLSVSNAPFQNVKRRKQ